MLEDGELELLLLCVWPFLLRARSWGSNQTLLSNEKQSSTRAYEQGEDPPECGSSVMQRQFKKRSIELEKKSNVNSLADELCEEKAETAPKSGHNCPSFSKRDWGRILPMFHMKMSSTAQPTLVLAIDQCAPLRSFN